MKVMKKSTKGALAATGAAVLLLGGAGTLAFWTDSATVTGTSINSGHLNLDQEDCGDGWTLDGGDVYTTQLLVPGDSLTRTCTYTLDVAGEHLTEVDIAVEAPADVTGAQELIEELNVTTAVALNGTAQASATNVPVKDGDKVTVSMTIEWPYGVEDNDSNKPDGLSATLDELTVTLTQNHDA